MNGTSSQLNLLRKKQTMEHCMTLRSELGSPSSVGDLPKNREMRLINIVMSESFRRRLMETSIPANKKQLENKEVGCKHLFWIDACKAFNNTDE